MSATLAAYLVHARVVVGIVPSGVTQLRRLASPIGDREAEGTAPGGCRLRPDAATVELDDPLADRQPDPGPGELVARVQALEGLEDPVCVLGVDSDAVVGNGQPPRIRLALRGHADLGPRVAGELDRVADQVLE